MDRKFRFNGGLCMIKRYIFLFFIGLIVSGCIAQKPKTPIGFNEKIIETEYFSFAVWEKDIVTGDPLRIYIEGDGDPTPREAIGLKLAQKDPLQNVIYVSRPCQYLYNKECKNPKIWGSERFHEEIVDEMKELIEYLAIKYKTPSLELVGYDGGGTMALLLATKIPVARVITIGGILDTEAYVSEHELDPINGLNPLNFNDILSRIEQTHYVGSNDSKTTRRMAERFVARLKNPRSATVKVIPNATHTNWGNVAFDYYK